MGYFMITRSEDMGGGPSLPNADIKKLTYESIPLHYYYPPP
jgi:hypothetical protein